MSRTGPSVRATTAFVILLVILALLDMAGWSARRERERLETPPAYLHRNYPVG
jgi:hypothetical protein